MSAERRSTATAARPPLHPMLASVPATCFAGTLLTDIAYWRTAEMMWADFSAWLVSAGVVLAWLAAIVGVVDAAVNRATHGRAISWPYRIAHAAILVLATLDMLVHTRDAWTSVVPWGLGLSALVVVLLLFATWIGWSAIYVRTVPVTQ